MKKLILKIALILLVVFAIDRGAAYKLNQRYMANEKNYAQGHLNYYLSHINADSLFMGSSRMLHHVDVREFGSEAYNLSHPGLHLGYQSAVLHLLEENNKLPSDVVIVDLEIGTIYKEQSSNLKSHIDYLRYFYDKSDYIKKEIDRERPLEFLKYYLSTYKYNGNVMPLIFNPIQGIGELPHPQGYWPLTLEQKKVINADFVEDEEDMTIDTLEFDYYLKSIRDLCERNHLTLYTVSSPYYNTTDKVKESSRLLNEITKRLEVTYFNFLEDKELLSLDSSYWNDDAHFNEKGAEVYTRKLKEAIDSQ